MPAFCPRCGDLLKSVTVCGKCHLTAVTTQSASFQTESGTAVELSPVHPPVEIATSSSGVVARAGSVRKLKKCGVCSNPIVGASTCTRRYGGNDVACHDSCLTCKQCRKPIDGTTRWTVVYNSAYHEACAVGLRVCHGCHEPIVGKCVDQDAYSFHRVCLDKHRKLSPPPCGERHAPGLPVPLGIGSDHAGHTNDVERATVALSTVDATARLSTAQERGINDAVATDEDHPSENQPHGGPSASPTHTATDHDPSIPSDMPKPDDVVENQALVPVASADKGSAQTWTQVNATERPGRVWPLPSIDQRGSDVNPTTSVDEPTYNSATTCTDIKRVVECLSCGHRIQDKAIEVPSGSLYHEKCFVCTTCEQRIDDDVVGFIQDGCKIFHPQCYYEHSGRLCRGCRQVVDVGAVKQRDKGQLFHPTCFRCADCSAPLTNEFLDLDGDDVCRECYFHHVVAKSTTEYMATATAATFASDPCQLAVAVGDKLTVLSEDWDGWTIAKNASHSMGYIPSASVRRSLD
ncbi:hypothetical protein H310_10171 [Aphanomyces invadans]|uniref:LIM zinc-binding domain-containing protein n=1 Tax=Aphanomyces invadans TaxID=157072 RepID=A0A024TTH9_9STRA|nr:hypothetical protein H310_10171 [Aphanomyces invadans]ETV96896.1 hypothetical protein H310_10171 [Aphanomyces invadans]|eukprot:XP_008874673.1 hypothetical protein H310_10171 [Aphanomyces invadans]